MVFGVIINEGGGLVELVRVLIKFGEVFVGFEEGAGGGKSGGGG